MDWHKALYVGFNAVEAVLWLGLALFVAVRAVRRQGLAVEAIYAFSFLAFGLTDVLEMQRLTPGLLALKLFVLLCILLCRHIVVRHYPGTSL